jgi:hypothetical protein
MTAIWLFLRAESRRRWRPWLSLDQPAGQAARASAWLRTVEFLRRLPHPQ